MPQPISVKTIPSNTTSKLMADSATQQSLFEGHLLQAENSNSVIHYTNYDYLIAAILLFIYSLFVVLYVKNRKRLNQVIKAFYINRFASQLAREEVSIVNRVSVILSIIFLFSMTLFTWQVIAFYGWAHSVDQSTLFFSILAIVIAIYTVKFTSIKFFGFVFKTTKESDEYALTVLLFINSLGLFLLPIVVCIAFAQNVSIGIFINIGLYTLGLFLLTRIVRGLIIGINSIRVSKLYLFLYLCSLEILPLLIMIKFFIKTIS
jgi:hypothetical protein